MNALQSVARLNSFFACSERLGRQRLKQAPQRCVQRRSKIAKIGQNDDFPAKPDFPRFPARFSSIVALSHPLQLFLAVNEAIVVLVESFPALPPLPPRLPESTPRSADTEFGYVEVKPPTAWCTYFFLASTLAVFFWQVHVFQKTGVDQVGDTLAFSASAWDDGRYWTLVSYAWVHSLDTFGSMYLHILGNMLGLFFLGPLVETVLGHLRFFFLYIGGAIFAGLTWFYLNDWSDHYDGAIIGASGAVFALIAAAGTAMPRLRVVVYFLFVLPIPMTLRTMALVACGIELALQVSGFFPQIGHTAHLGGAIFGLVYTFLCTHLMQQRVLVSTGKLGDL